MWSVGRLQVHEMCTASLVYTDVVEALDLYVTWI